jgi:hypothetical protein
MRRLQHLREGTLLAISAAAMAHTGDQFLAILPCLAAQIALSETEELSLFMGDLMTARAQRDRNRID